MVYVRIRTEGDYGEIAEYEGDSEEAFEAIKEQEKTFKPSVAQPKVIEAEIEGYDGETTEEEYDDFLDEIYPEVQLGYSTFLPSRIIKELDPVSYRIGKSEYQESRVESAEDEVGIMDDEQGDFWDKFFNFMRGY